MNKLKHSLFAKSILGLMLIGLTATAAEPKKILVVTTTTEFRHSSIATAEKVLAKIGEQSKLFTVDYAQQPAHQPTAPKKPGANATPEESQKFQADSEKFKAADAEWQTALKENLSKLSVENLK